EQMRATHEALGHLYRAVASLRREFLPGNPRQYGLFADGPVYEIRKLQSEIDEYLGLRQPGALHADALRESSGPYDGDLPR
ncbi:MAG: hypothetical protein ACREXY_25560, partial [Gammaproteobacteria bacterium]